MNKLSDVSTYFLILELMNEGDAGLLPEIEPLDEIDIVTELEQRSNEDHGSEKEAWAKWFLGNQDHGSELERANFLIFMETRKAMLMVMKKISADD